MQKATTQKNSWKIAASVSLGRMPGLPISFHVRLSPDLVPEEGAHVSYQVANDCRNGRPQVVNAQSMGWDSVKSLPERASRPPRTRLICASP